MASATSNRYRATICPCSVSMTAAYIGRPPGHSIVERVGLFDEPVSHADDGFDPLASVSELAAQAPDMHIDRARFDLALESPDPFQQPIAREDTIAVLDEKSQQLEFTLRESDRQTGNAHCDRIEIDGE